MSLLHVYAMRSLLVSALICVFHLNAISSHAVFKNVAYSKPVTLSSRFKNYPESNVVNGLLSDYTHTSAEKFPWLRIDLRARFKIRLIEVFARSGCCGKYLHIHFVLL